MARTIKDVLDEANPNKLPSGAQIAKLGSALSLEPAFIDAGVTANAIALPSAAKAALGLAAFASAGGATGPLAYVAGGAPVAGEFSVSASGDIVFAAADAVTRAEVLYLPIEGEVITESVFVAASSAALPSGRKAVLLLSASVVSGIIPGAKTVVARGGAPAAGEAAINAAGTAIAFNAADVVAGSCELTYVVTPGSGGTSSLNSRLAEQADF
jgi:hypothetical protein